MSGVRAENYADIIFGSFISISIHGPSRAIKCGSYATPTPYTTDVAHDELPSHKQVSIIGKYNIMRAVTSKLKAQETIAKTSTKQSTDRPVDPQNNR